jgi:hypothetical protein
LTPGFCVNKLFALQTPGTNKLDHRPAGRRIAPRCIALATVLLAACALGRANSSPCYAGFELSQACITERGLDQKVAAFQRKIAQAMIRLSASYKFSLRVVNNPAEAGYYPAATSDVFTDVVRDDEMRNASFIINVTADFLEKQPEILFEASSLHEVCHVMNDDLTGYHRNGANVEAAEEHCVLEAVGESRYEQYLRAYAAYQHWDTLTYDRVLEKVKDLVLAQAPIEIDEADRAAQEYFRTHADGKEHLLVYNGELHDVSLSSTRDQVRHDPAKLNAVINAGKPMIFFHNHPPDGRAAMFPSYDDFGVAGLFSFMVFRENPSLSVEFRVVELSQEATVVSYGFKGAAVEDIKKIAVEYRDATARQADVAPIEIRQAVLDYHLAQDAFNDYLQYACPVDLSREDPEVCRTHPEYFLWPSHRFFVHYRPH